MEDEDGKSKNAFFLSFDFDEALDYVPYLEDILNNAFEEVLDMDEQ
jgi:hypothetical protein